MFSILASLGFFFILYFLCLFRQVSGLQFENAVVILDTETVDDTGRYISLKSLTLNVGQAVVLQLSGSPGHNEL